MGPDQRDDLSEHLGRYDLHFVKDEQAPIDALNLVHVELLVFVALAGITDHGVCTDHDTSLGWLEHLAAFFRSECNHRRPMEVCPSVELLAPLGNGHIAATKHKRALLNVRGCRDTCQSFASTAWQHNNSRPRPSIAEHFAEALFLVVSYHRGRLELNLQVGCLVVLTKVVFFDEREVCGFTVLLDCFDVCGRHLDLEAV